MNVHAISTGAGRTWSGLGLVLPFRRVDAPSICMTLEEAERLANSLEVRFLGLLCLLLFALQLPTYFLLRTLMWPAKWS